MSTQLPDFMPQVEKDTVEKEWRGEQKRLVRTLREEMRTFSKRQRGARKEKQRQASIGSGSKEMQKVEEAFRASTLEDEA